MARIRTVKPEFFTSDDICGLSAYARLLYIGLWCEADREGRMEWKPRSFKRRYLPDDNVDINELCAELTKAGLVVLYGDDLAYIPTFAKHQHINPRETVSSLPEPDASARVNNASARDSDAQGGREGKGKEGKESDANTRQSPAITFKSWLESIPEGEKAIPADDPVYAYADKVGLPEAYLRLEWEWFKRKYLTESKRQKSWPQKFRNAVEGGWGSLWRIGADGQFFLTTEGQQLQRSLPGGAQ